MFQHFVGADDWVGTPSQEARRAGPHAGVHFDNGFFATADGGRGGERLGTIAASWLDGALVVETWNDRFGGEHKDHGPTGGGQIYLRIPNLRGR